MIELKRLANQTTYQFACEYIRDCFYESISKSDRERLHVKIAEMFEEQFSKGKCNLTEVIALGIDSVSSKERFEKAVLWWSRTAKIAMNRLALPEALEALSKTRDLISKLEWAPGNIKTELQLLLDTATANEILLGPAAPEVKNVYKDAKRLAEETNEISLLFRTQWQSWFFAYAKGNLTSAQQIAEGLLRTPAYRQNTKYRLEACHAMWDTLFHLGQLRSALPYHFQGMVISRDLSDEKQRQGYAGHAASVCCLSRGALLLWCLEFIDQSLSISQEAIKLAGCLEHSNSQAQAHSHSALLNILRQDPKRTQFHAKQAMAFAKKRVIKPRLILSQILLDISQLQKQPNKNTIEQFEQNICEWKGIGIRLFETLWSAIIAEACLKIGDLDKGSKNIDDALKVIEDTQELLYQSELYRLKGELLLATSKKNRAKAKLQFKQAIEIARKLNIKPLELRALGVCSSIRYQKT